MERRNARSRPGSLAARVVLASSAAGAALVAAWAVAGPAAAATSSVSRSSATQSFTLYAVATKKQFVNNTDDLARGVGHNPFGNYASSTINTRANEKVYGPFPGDEGEFAFALYTSATDQSKKTAAGSAIVICQYNFNQDAFCDASFQLNGGSLVGKGAFNFNSKTSTLAIIGGTFKYRSMKGAVTGLALGTATQGQPVFRVVPMLQAQRLAFVIQHA